MCPWVSTHEHGISLCGSTHTSSSTTHLSTQQKLKVRAQMHRQTFKKQFFNMTKVPKAQCGNLNEFTAISEFRIT